MVYKQKETLVNESVRGKRDHVREREGFQHIVSQKSLCFDEESVHTIHIPAKESERRGGTSRQVGVGQISICE